MAKRQVVLVSARDWQRRLAALEKKPTQERREFEEKSRYEISLTEDRKQALALIREKLGPGETGWERASARGGCSVWTYRTWDDETRNVQPRDQSFKKTAVALGINYGFHE